MVQRSANKIHLSRYSISNIPISTGSICFINFSKENILSLMDYLFSKKSSFLCKRILIFQKFQKSAINLLSTRHSNSQLPESIGFISSINLLVFHNWGKPGFCSLETSNKVLINDSVILPCW